MKDPFTSSDEDEDMEEEEEAKDGKRNQSEDNSYLSGLEVEVGVFDDADVPFRCRWSDGSQLTPGQRPPDGKALEVSRDSGESWIGLGPLTGEAILSLSQGQQSLEDTLRMQNMNEEAERAGTTTAAAAAAAAVVGGGGSGR